MLRTRFTDLLGLDYPIMSAPMSNHSGGQLAAAVSLAGASGRLGAPTTSVRSGCESKFPISAAGPVAPLVLDSLRSSSSTTQQTSK